MQEIVTKPKFLRRTRMSKDSQTVFPAIQAVSLRKTPLSPNRNNTASILTLHEENANRLRLFAEGQPRLFREVLEH